MLWIVLWTFAHFPSSAWASISNNCNPFLLSQFFSQCCFLYTWHISSNLKALYTSSLKFFSSLHLSSVSQLEYGLLHHWCYFGSHALSCTHLLACLLCFFVWLLLYMCFWNLPLWRLPCSIILLCWDCLFWVCLMCAAYICLFETFYSWQSCRVPCLIEDNTDVCLYVYLLLCANEYNLQYVCMLKYVEVVHSSRLYTWLSLVILYTIDCACWLISAIPILLFTTVTQC